MKNWQTRFWVIPAAGFLLAVATPLSSLASAASAPGATLATHATPRQSGANILALEHSPAPQPDIQRNHSSTPPVSQVRFVGRTSPNALVAVILDDNLLRVAVADMEGDFVTDIELAEAVASPTFSLFAQDTLRLQTAHVQVRPEPGDDGLGTADLLIMPPTFKVLTPVTSSSGGVTLAGSGVPATDIVFVIDSELRLDVVRTGLDGFWSVSLEGPWEVGEHSIHALNWDSRGLTSPPSVVDRFTATK